MQLFPEYVLQNMSSIGYSVREETNMIEKQHYFIAFLKILTDTIILKALTHPVVKIRLPLLNPELDYIL